MEQIELQAEKREITGRKVSQLRRAGMAPVILYGHNVDSLPLQVPAQVLARVLRQAGGNRLISLRIDAETARTVLVKEVQWHPTSHMLLHADFQEVVMTEKIMAEVPIELVGEPPVLAAGAAVLIQGVDQLEIQCLPGDLPPAIRIDLSQLTELDQAILVRDIPLGRDIDVLSDPEEMIVKLLRARQPTAEEMGMEELEEEVEEVTEPEVLSKQRRAEREIKEPASEDEEETWG